MGCDIHLYVERRVDGKWVTADEWQKSEWDDEPGSMEVPYEKSFYSDRNYNLFSILADVRNGRGFAGLKTGSGFVPISPPKGVPDDCSKEYRAYQDRYGCDGHSHSYLSVAEIMSYDWTRVTRLEGWVSPTEWARFKARGEPDSWSGMVSGGFVTHHDEEAFQNAWERVRDENGWPEQRMPFAHMGPFSDGRDVTIKEFCVALGSQSPYTHVSWEKPYYECAKDFLGTVMPRLWALGSPDDVRIVFFFDN